MARPTPMETFPIAAPPQRGALRDLLGGALLLSVLVGLWTFFALGVAAPAGHLAGEPGRPAAAQVRG